MLLAHRCHKQAHRSIGKLDNLIVRRSLYFCGGCRNE